VTITRQGVARKMVAYLRHRISQRALVDWAEAAMMEGRFDERDAEAIRDVVARLGVSDVRAFGLTWDDCRELLERLGYSARVEIAAR
jgi:hypothetical protein